MTEPTGPAVGTTRHMTTIHLLVVCFFWTIGGFYGTEGILDTGAPVVVLAVCCALPLLYSAPTALVAVELATMFPETTGGQCDYVRRAAGQRLGAHNTYWVWVTCVIDSALYPQFVAASLQNEFGFAAEWRQLLPVGIVVAMAGVNMAGIDWLLRFEVLLGALTLLPCIAVLVVGTPKLDATELLDGQGQLRVETMLSWGLWLYGGFTNIGVLAGEAITPKHSYLICLAVLLPMKVVFRFAPFLIAFSLAPPANDDELRFGEGYFASLAEQLGGRWLGISYLIGAQIAFIGFYNAMVINAERTAAFFCEAPVATVAVSDSNIAAKANWDQQSDEIPLLSDDSSSSSSPNDHNGGRCGHDFDQIAGRGGCCGRFWFGRPTHGVRRVYSLVVATIECGLVFLSTDLLVELEMMIYSVSFLLFMFSYVKLRRQHSHPSVDVLQSWVRMVNQTAETQHRYVDNATGAKTAIEVAKIELRNQIEVGQKALHMGFLTDTEFYATVRRLRFKWQSRWPTRTAGDGIFIVPGGWGMSVVLVFCPVLLFTASTGLALRDSGCATGQDGELVCRALFPYFKLVAFVFIIGAGIIIELFAVQCKGQDYPTRDTRRRSLQVSAGITSMLTEKLTTPQSRISLPPADSALRRHSAPFVEASSSS